MNLLMGVTTIIATTTTESSVGHVVFGPDLGFSSSVNQMDNAGNQSGGSDYGRIIMMTDRTEIIHTNGTFGAIANTLWEAQERLAGGSRRETQDEGGVAAAPMDAEYIFDRLDVRIIFITLYSVVFACCFFGKCHSSSLLVVE